MNSGSGGREEDEQEVGTRERESETDRGGEIKRVRARENEPDVLANMVREPQAAQSPPHLTGSRPNLPQ